MLPLVSHWTRIAVKFHGTLPATALKDETHTIKILDDIERSESHSVHSSSAHPTVTNCVLILSSGVKSSIHFNRQLQ